jgi:hypothetical protein
MAPTWVLPCQPQHDGPHLGWHGRAPALAGRLAPRPAHERPMPTQRGPRSDQTRAAQGAWQMAGRRPEQGTISTAELRPRDLATEHLELVAQDQQLEVLDVQATTTPNERAQQAPERRGRRRPHWRPSQPAREGRDTTIGALRGPTCLGASARPWRWPRSVHRPGRPGGRPASRPRRPARRPRWLRRPRHQQHRCDDCANAVLERFVVGCVSARASRVGVAGQGRRIDERAFGVTLQRVAEDAVAPALAPGQQRAVGSGGQRSELP